MVSFSIAEVKERVTPEPSGVIHRPDRVEVIAVQRSSRLICSFLEVLRVTASQIPRVRPRCRLWEFPDGLSESKYEDSRDVSILTHANVMCPNWYLPPSRMPLIRVHVFWTEKSVIPNKGNGRDKGNIQTRELLCKHPRLGGGSVTTDAAVFGQTSSLFL